MAAIISKKKFIKKELFALAFASVCFNSWAAYPNVETALEAITPNVAVTAPQLSLLVATVNNLSGRERQEALLTISPLVDGSFRAASQGPMRQMLSVLDERLRIVAQGKPPEGIASGDETPDPYAADAAAKPKDKVANKQPVKDTDPYSKLKAKHHRKAADDAAKAPATNQAESKDHDKTKDKAKDSAKTQDKAQVKAQDKAKENDKTKVNGKDKPKAKAFDPIIKEIGGAPNEPSIESHQASYEDLTKATYIKGLWGQLLGDDIRQQERNDIPGYHAQVGGGIIGWDRPFFSQQLTLGVAGGYQHAHVNSKAEAHSVTDIKRVQATLYGFYYFDPCPFYIKAALTGANNDYDQKRHMDVEGYPNSTAQGDFNAWEINAYIEKGYLGKRGNLTIIPKIMLMYSRLRPHHYTEKDAGALDLDVRYEHMDSLPLGAGLLMEYQNEFPQAYVVPEIHGYYFYDFIRDAQTATATFFGTNISFLTEGVKPGASNIEVGAGLVVHSFTNTMVRFQYDYVQSSGYHRNQAFIKVRYEWA
jgi:uncharacterized protein YhjY with autotransporter beta-barrel domain